MKLKRSIPFIESLAKIKINKEKINALRHFPDYVIEDIIEILFNVVQNNCQISKKQKSLLRKQRKDIEKMLKLAGKHRKKPKHILRGQTGGFIGTLIPIILSVLNGIL